MRRGQLVQLLLLSVVFAGIATIVAIFVPWLPDPATKEMGRITFVFWMATIISIAVFAVVAAVLAYSIWKFRAPPDDDSDGPPIHGNTTVEIVWTAIPALLVTALSIASGIVLAKDDHMPKNALRVDVTAQQFAWSFQYPELGKISSATLRLPLGRPVDLSIRALDVLHSFWVPEFGQKQDGVPGSVNHLKVTPTRVGTYPVICTELCGLGHATMRSEAEVMPAAEFDEWAAAQRRAASAGGADAGKALYTENGCGGCHTFAPAGSKGNVGPDLDTLAAAAQKAGKPLDEFVRESIVQPSAYVAPGYPDNVMPKTYGQLPKPSVDALVQYLTQSSKRKG